MGAKLTWRDSMRDNWCQAYSSVYAVGKGEGGGGIVYSEFENNSKIFSTE